MNNFESADSSLFFTKNDIQDPRLGEWTSAYDWSFKPAPSDTFLIYGYPDDEGILLNGGRIGAKEAPNRIRQFLYKMTPALGLNSKTGKKFSILDGGNLKTLGVELETRHRNGRQTAQKATESGIHFIALGGGHDYGYCESTGFCEAVLASGQKPVVINFDAHLDVRPTDKGLNSGTPFFRLLQEFENKIHFFEVGIQEHCNSKNHLEWATKKGAEVLSLNNLVPRLKQLNLDKSPIFLSLDIDVFSSSIAPGCSQSWVSGIDYKEFDFVHQQLINNFHVKALGVYEVSPALDFDNHTSKLAAKILHTHIHLVSGK